MSANRSNDRLAVRSNRPVEAIVPKLGRVAVGSGKNVRYH